MSPADEIALLLNGQPHAARRGDRLDRVLDTWLGERGADGLAVAVNETVVPRSLWSKNEIHEGDRIEILEAAQGG